MDKQEIYVPLFVWLLGASRIGGDYNRYYGSFGTDPEKGAIGGKIFNYTIYIEKIDEAEYIKAAVWSGMSSFGCCNEDEITSETFDCESESLPIIKAWIEDKKREFFA